MTGAADAALGNVFLGFLPKSFVVFLGLARSLGMLLLGLIRSSGMSSLFLG